MTKITHLTKWMKGKTVVSTDTSAENCTRIVFKDKQGVRTACVIEAEQMGGGFIGPVYYEVPVKLSRRKKVAA